MAKIILDDLVILKLKELGEILYEDEYFGFVEDALEYADSLKEFIYTIPDLKHKRTSYTKYGSYYCKYKHNHKTTWYITFDVDDDTYLILNITNNHSADYPKFISWLQ
jgi:hypothetical protein